MPPIIEVQNLSKRYELGVIGSTTFRESLERSWHRFRGRDPKAHMSKVDYDQLVSKGKDERVRASSEKELWALKDVSLTVEQGEVLGLIGRNGAGKSTLLKILSRITEPTSGHAVMRGRVASLLEVGTGFHPELTGRENVFLNGAILGMSKAEIVGKFDQIVCFAEIERYIDTPVKRYSSGMYVRLAFAVAAHLEPEILVVDEVLAVGDMTFQRKCLGKMSDVAHEGRTVLFVSHNMSAINNLCTRACLLRDGSLEYMGDVRTCVDRYVQQNRSGGSTAIWSEEEAPGGPWVKILSVKVYGKDEASSEVFMTDDVIFELTFKNLRDGYALYSGFQLFSRSDVAVMASMNWPSASSQVDTMAGKAMACGTYTSRCVIPGGLLNDGSYYFNAFVMDQKNQTAAQADEAVSITLLDPGHMRKEYSGGWLGVLRIPMAWSTTERSSAV